MVLPKRGGIGNWHSKIKKKKVVKTLQTMVVDRKKGIYFVSRGGIHIFYPEQSRLGTYFIHF